MRRGKDGGMFGFSRNTRSRCSWTEMYTVLGKYLDEGGTCEAGEVLGRICTCSVSGLFFYLSVSSAVTNVHLFDTQDDTFNLVFCIMKYGKKIDMCKPGKPLISSLEAALLRSKSLAYFDDLPVSITLSTRPYISILHLLSAQHIPRI